MTRTKLKDRILPKYTKGEEIFNMTTHIVGGALGVVALVLCVVFASIHGNPYAIVSSVIYGVSMILLYTMSSIYHGLSPKLTAKKVFQIFDHCSIFVLIAGTYTPFCLVTFLNYSKALGWWMFGILWFVAALGILLNSIDIKIHLLPQLLTIPGIVLLASGGVAYTLGAILYGLGTKIKYMHSVFHIFICIGSLLQFLCILLYVV